MIRLKRKLSELPICAGVAAWHKGMLKPPGFQHRKSSACASSPLASILALALAILAGGAEAKAPITTAVRRPEAVPAH